MQSPDGHYAQAAVLFDALDHHRYFVFMRNDRDWGIVLTSLDMDNDIARSVLPDGVVKSSDDIADGSVCFSFKTRWGVKR
jgi:hypothetical protein